MHFEVPKAKTFKEFGGEYLMIVISIITALALEHGVQTLHHRHLAHEASVKIETEIQANVRELDAVLKHNEAEVDKLKTLRKQLLEGIKNKTGDAELLQQLDLGSKLSLSISMAALRREAWEVAVANQSVTWMAQEKLERYSAIYATQRDAQLLSNTGPANFLNGPKMFDTISNLQLGMGDAKEVYRLVNQMIVAYDIVNNNLKDLRASLAKPPAAH